MKKLILAVLALTITTLTLAGCAAADVVLKYAPGSFEKITDKYPGLITDKTLTDHYYYVTVDKETTLMISHDYNLTGTDDMMIQTPLKPFVDAGLDVTKLGNGYKVIDDQFYLTADYGKGTGMKDDVTDSIFDSVKTDRGSLSYHQKLDHYGIQLTAGKFEWAKDYTTNDKDIVFIIKAQSLKNLGVNVNNITGWTFATVRDADGTNVDVLLKAYNLDV